MRVKYVDKKGNTVVGEAVKLTTYEDNCIRADIMYASSRGIDVMPHTFTMDNESIDDIMDKALQVGYIDLTDAICK